MKARMEFEGRVARLLAGHAARVARPEHAEWIAGMVRELEHLPPGESTLSWALGCVFVSYAKRLQVMSRSSADWPRWLLLLEMLLCLGPVSAYFVFVAVSTAQGYLLFTLPYTPVQEGLAFGFSTLVGPVGLVAGYRALFPPRRGPGPAVIGLLCLLVAWALVVSAGLLVAYHAGPFDFLWVLVPMVLLPAVAVAHLAWIGSSRRRESRLLGA